MKSIFTKFKITPRAYLLISAFVIISVAGLLTSSYWMVDKPTEKQDVAIDSPQNNKTAENAVSTPSQEVTAPAKTEEMATKSTKTKSTGNKTQSAASNQPKTVPSQYDLNFQTIEVYDRAESDAKNYILPGSYQGWKNVSLAYHVGINDSYPDDSFPDRYKALEIAGLEQNFTLPASFDAIAKIRAQLKDEAMKVNDIDIEVRHKIWYQNRKVETVLPILILELQKFDTLLDKYRQTINSTPPLINPL